MCVNALNGLSSFLLMNKILTKAVWKMCQRPKRAFFISTFMLRSKKFRLLAMCQRPKRAFFISTPKQKLV